MWEHFISRLGFRNIYQGGQITGFQFKIHIPYYRGIWVSMMSDDFVVKVDGVNYPLDKVTLKIMERIIPWSQVDMTNDVFWTYGTLATVMVEKPGGLDVGLHNVECGFTVRKSYQDEDPDPEGYNSYRTQFATEAPAQQQQRKSILSDLQTCSLEMALVI